MTNSGYVPATDAGSLLWINNFSSKIGLYATPLGIATTEVTSVHNDAAYYSFTLNMLESSKQTVNNIVSFKKLLKHASAQQHLSALPSFPTLGTAPAGVPEGIFD
jgi:hypothetical protein